MQDDRPFAEILQACLEATSAGRTSVEECVARYPQHAALLDDLLHLSGQVRDLPLPTPTPEMLAAGERWLLQAARAQGRAGCRGWLRSAWGWLACGAAAALGGLWCLICAITVVVIVIIQPWPPCPTPTRTPTAVPTATYTIAPTWTPTVLPTATATATGTPTALPPTLIPTATPLPTDTPVPPTPTSARQPKPSLGFHPDELRAEGCETSYRAVGSLKNHGGEEANWAANVQIGHQVVKGAEYVAQVVISPDFWPVIGGNETVNYSITVDTTAGWSGQRDKEIKIRLTIAREDNRPGHHQTQAHFTIVNRCP